MNKPRWLALAALAALAGLAAIGSRGIAPAQDPAQERRDQRPAESPELAAVRRTADAFTKAFNAGDAKAVAAFWTNEGEFTDADGETIRGRDEIEKGYRQFFQEHPKASIEVKIQGLRLIGPRTSVEEGILKLRLPGEKEPKISRYTVLHVREEEGWHMASVREWVPDPAELVTLKDVEWLLGEWTAKGPGGEVRVTYAWDEPKAFLRGRYTLSRDQRVVGSGTHIIGKDPTGGLRSWVFDGSGATGEGSWSRDEDRWVIETAGTLPDGNAVTGVNVLIPLDKDSFTWQALERTVAGSPLPAATPLKVTRVKADK